MSELKKNYIYIECTHTYTSGLNTGIQRVVREIIKNLPMAIATENYEVRTVIFDNGVFKEVNFSSQYMAPKPSLLRKVKNFCGVCFKKAREAMAWFVPEGRIKFFINGPRYNPRTLAYNMDRFLVAPLGYIIWRIRKLVIAKKNKLNSENAISSIGLQTTKSDIFLLLDSSWYIQFWEALDLIKKNGTPIINIVYDIIPISHPQFCDDYLAHVFKSYFLKSIEYVDKYICISETVSKGLTQFLSETKTKSLKTGKDKNLNEKNFKEKSLKISFFHLGSNFSIKDYKLESVSPVARSVFSKSKPTYLIVSTIEPRKNHSYLLDVFDQLWKDNQDISLCIVGRIGWKVDEVLTRILKHPQLGKKLFMLNEASDIDVAFCYRNSIGLLFPSFVEGFGLPIIEGLQYQLPVFASKTDIHQEVGQDKIQYFELDDPGTLIGLILKHQKAGFKNEIDFQHNQLVPITTWQESAQWLWKEIKY